MHPIKCRFCPAMLIFIETPKHRRIPVRADSYQLFTLEPKGYGTPENRVQVVKEDGTIETGVPARVLVPQVEYRTIEGYIPHWGECPGATQARRKP